MYVVSEASVTDKVWPTSTWSSKICWEQTGTTEGEPWHKVKTVWVCSGTVGNGSQLTFCRSLCTCNCNLQVGSCHIPSQNSWWTDLESSHWAIEESDGYFSLPATTAVSRYSYIWSVTRHILGVVWIYRDKLDQLLLNQLVSESERSSSALSPTVDGYATI